MTTYREFEAAMADGADCEHLIELRERLPIQDKEAAADQLRRKGCLRADSQRGDQLLEHEPYVAEDDPFVRYASAE